jgi:beta-phosphoglucomutase
VQDRQVGVIFDLDGVLADTAELHFQSWMDLARELGIQFDRLRNEALRGLSRADSLRLFLGEAAGRFDLRQQAELMERKNRYYLRRVAELTAAEVLPGARELLLDLRRRGASLAIASSSRNARIVLERLELLSLPDVIVDGYDVEKTKPDPEIFLLAARRLGLPLQRCVVVEDAESGVAAALAAGAKVVGIGPPERVGRAHLVVSAIAELDADTLLGLVGG